MKINILVADICRGFLLGLFIGYVLFMGYEFKEGGLERLKGDKNV